MQLIPEQPGQDSSLRPSGYEALPGGHLLHGLQGFSDIASGCLRSYLLISVHGSRHELALEQAARLRQMILDRPISCLGESTWLRRPTRYGEAQTFDEAVSRSAVRTHSGERCCDLRSRSSDAGDDMGPGRRGGASPAGSKPTSHGTRQQVRRMRHPPPRADPRHSDHAGSAGRGADPAVDCLSNGGAADAPRPSLLSARWGSLADAAGDTRLNAEAGARRG